MLDGSAPACVVLCIYQEQNGKITKYEFWAVPFYRRNYRDKSCNLKYAIHRVALSVYHYCVVLECSGVTLFLYPAWANLSVSLVSC